MGNKFEIVSILPNQIKEMKRGRKTKIQLKVSEKLSNDISDITKDLVQHIYFLGINDSELKIYPANVMVTDDDTFSIFFNMNN